MAAAKRFYAATISPGPGRQWYNVIDRTTDAVWGASHNTRREAREAARKLNEGKG